MHRSPKHCTPELFFSLLMRELLSISNVVFLDRFFDDISYSQRLRLT
jgi:hypothetical protein